MSMLCSLAFQEAKLEQRRADATEILALELAAPEQRRDDMCQVQESF